MTCSNGNFNGIGGRGLPIRCGLEVKTELVNIIKCLKELGPIHHSPLKLTFFLNETLFERGYI